MYYQQKTSKQNIMLAIVIDYWIIISSISACNDGKTMLRVGGLSEYEKQIIIDMHNRLRQSVALGQVGNQPPAANMIEFKWDHELANKAQNWASTCLPYIHDTSRHISRFHVGQNVAKAWTTKFPATEQEMKADFVNDAFNKWFKEFKYYAYKPYAQGTTGHVTQMIWAETNLIGCGYAFYYDPSKGFTKNYVCNYGPSGNVYGQVPYQKGYPNCYNYGLSDSRKYHGLCEKSTRYVYDLSGYFGNNGLHQYWHF